MLDVAPAHTDQDYCSHASVGFVPAQEMRLLVPKTIWTTWKGHDLDLMTVAYVLFPIACAIAFFAAAFAFCGVIGSLIASVLCATAFVVTLPVMVVAFVSFGYLKKHVQAAGLSAHYGVGMWTCLAAFILLFLAMLLLLFSCCSGLRGKRKERKHYSEKGRTHREDSERSLSRTRSNDNHHYGRDAAVGGIGMGAYEANKRHRDHGTGHRNDDHHYGRDAALGGAGVGAYAAGKHHRDHNTGHDDRRYVPANAAAARAMEGIGGRHHMRGADHGTSDDSELAHQDRSNIDQDRPNIDHNPSHHHGREVVLGGGVAGAGLAAHEYERSRANPTIPETVAPAPREHRLRTTMRNSSNRGYEEPQRSGGYEEPQRRGGYEEPQRSRGYEEPQPSRGYEEPQRRGDYAPVHHITTGSYSGTRFPSLRETQMQPHPTTTTTTTTYADRRGVRNTGLRTTTHDPATGRTREYAPGEAF